MRLFVRSAMVLGLVFALAGVGIVVVRTQRPSKKTVTTFLETVQLETQTPAERAKTIRRVVRMLGELRPDERAHLEREGLTGKFLHSLTPGEQEEFFVKLHPADSGR